MWHTSSLVNLTALTVVPGDQWATSDNSKPSLVWPACAQLRQLRLQGDHWPAPSLQLLPGIDSPGMYKGWQGVLQCFTCLTSLEVQGCRVVHSSDAIAAVAAMLQMRHLTWQVSTLEATEESGGSQLQLPCSLTHLCRPTCNHSHLNVLHLAHCRGINTTGRRHQRHPHGAQQGLVTPEQSRPCKLHLPATDSQPNRPQSATSMLPMPSPPQHWQGHMAWNACMHACSRRHCCSAIVTMAQPWTA
jgi:hypothetical protein